MSNHSINARSCVHWITIILFLVVLQGCSNDQEIYELGYQQAQIDMAERASLFRQSLKETMVLQLTLASTVLSLFAWKGSEMIEQIRSKLLVEVMHIPVRYQLAIIVCIYSISSLSLLVFACNRYGMPYAFPILIASSCSFYLFAQYALAFSAGKTDRRKHYATKVMQMLSFCLIVVLIYEILSDAGFLGLSVGVS